MWLLKNIKNKYLCVANEIEPVNTEGCKFHILPLLFLYSWVVNTFYLYESQIKQTYCDYFKNIEKKLYKEPINH